MPNEPAFYMNDKIFIHHNLPAGRNNLFIESEEMNIKYFEFLLHHGEGFRMRYFNIH